MKVELETKFNIGDKVKRYSNGEICTVEDIYIDFGKNNIKKIYYHARNETNKTDLCLSGCLLEKAHILDKQEHDYLRAVCKPYDVEYIYKTNEESNIQYITIIVKSKSVFGTLEILSMPCFNRNSMYKGMKVNKKYTIEELELDKEWNNDR